MDDKEMELFDRLDNNKIFGRIHKMANMIVEDGLDPEESWRLLNDEFKLTWNQNKEVQWAANNLLNNLTKEITKRGTIDKELWDNLEPLLREKYNCGLNNIVKEDL